MRKGPHPLPVHLGIAMSSVSGIHDYTAQFGSSKNEAQMVVMMRGIKMYQEHPYKPKKQKLLTLWQEGDVRILSAQQTPDFNANISPLLLVPSLVNRSDILNLSSERSLMRWLNDRGIPCLLLDWGDLIKSEEQNVDIEYIVQDILVKSILNVSKIAGKPVDVLGYCMGGTLLLGAQRFIGSEMGRIILLAAPWDFHAPDMILTRNVRLWAPFALPAVQQKGCLEAQWTQALFASLDPEGSAHKFARFAEMDQDSDEAKLFLQVEDWLNDGVDLPAPIAQHCIQEWFSGNKTYKREWVIGGQIIKPEDITNPVFIIASHGDKLVPYSSAANLEVQLKNTKTDILELDCGHIGFVAGKQSIERVWQPLLEWLQRR